MSRRKTIVLVLVVVPLVALLMAGVGWTVYAHVAGGDSTPKNAAGVPSSTSAHVTTAPQPSTPAKSADPAASACGLAAGDQKPPKTAPAAHWVFNGAGLSYPESKTAGPARTTPTGARVCFAHSPTGALFAASAFIGRAANTDSTAEPQLRAQVLNNVDAAVKRNVTDQQGQSADPSLTGSVSGYQIRSYSADQAVVTLAMSFSGGQVVTVSVGLTWSGGDWKVPALADGSWPQGGMQVGADGAIGLTPWSPTAGG